MKKFFSILVIGMAMVLMPMVASAAIKLEVKRSGNCIDNGGDTCKWTYSLKLVGDSEQNYASIPIKIAYATKEGKQNAVVQIDFNAPTGMTADAIPNGNGYDVIYTPTSGSVTGKTIDLGTFVATVKKGAEYDCTLNVGFGDIKVDVEIETETTIPSTGASLPVIIIAGGVSVAVVAYVISKKNTKLYKI